MQFEVESRGEELPSQKSPAVSFLNHLEDPSWCLLTAWHFGWPEQPPEELLPGEPWQGQTQKGRGAEGEGVPAGSQHTFSFSGCSCGFCFVCDLLSPYYRHKSLECTPETFPCSSQIGKDPSQRKTQHPANGKPLQCPLFSCTENTLVLKDIGRKICVLQARYEVVSPSSEAVVKEQFLQSNQK